MSEALKILQEFRENKRYSYMYDRIDTAIEEVLAKPEQEPVAWMWTRKYGDGGYTDMVFKFLCDAEEYAKNSQNLKRPDIITPLYTSPPTRKLLSDEEICNLYYNVNGAIHKFARAIEKAHGITGVDDE